MRIAVLIIAVVSVVLSLLSLKSLLNNKSRIIKNAKKKLSKKRVIYQDSPSVSSK